MKILLLNYEYPPIGAGAGVISQHIADGLAVLGHEVTVITAWFPGESDKEIKGNLTIIRLHSKRKYVYKSNVFEMISWAKISKAFLDDFCIHFSFDVTFANFSLPGGDVALHLKNKFSIPFVLISHGHDIPWFFPAQMFFYHLLTYQRIKRICLASERNFIQSCAMKNNIDRFVGLQFKTKNIIIPNGSDFNKFKPDYSLKSENFKIIFVGRLVRQKDPFTFLKAIKLFSISNQDFHVHIIGDGPLRYKMEYFVGRNNLSDKVKFSGWISKDELVGEYQSAHIKVAPSLEEGMSISIMESLASGHYVITTPVSENQTLIQEQVTGEITNLRDYKDIADRLQKFYFEKFSKGYTIPEEVLMQHREQYGWNSIVDQYEKELLLVTGGEKKITESD